MERVHLTHSQDKQCFSPYTYPNTKSTDAKGILNPKSVITDSQGITD